MTPRPLLFLLLFLGVPLLPAQAVAQTPTGNFGFAISGGDHPIHRLQVGVKPSVDQNGLNCDPVFSTNRVSIGDSGAQVVPAGSRGEYRVKCKFRVTDSDGDRTRIRVKGIAELITREDGAAEPLRVRPYLKLLLKGKKKLDLDGDITTTKVELKGRSFFNVFNAFVQLKPRLKVCLFGTCAGEPIKFALNLAPGQGDWSVSNGNLSETDPGVFGGSATVSVGGLDLPFDVAGTWNGDASDHVELVSQDFIEGKRKKARACDDGPRQNDIYPVHWLRLENAMNEPGGISGSLEVCLYGQRYSIDPFVLDLTP